MNEDQPEWKANCCVQWPELASQMMVVCGERETIDRKFDYVHSMISSHVSKCGTSIVTRRKTGLQCLIAKLGTLENSNVDMNDNKGNTFCLLSIIINKVLLITDLLYHFNIIYHYL